MNVLVVSKELIGASICQKLKSEGHSVKLYIEDKTWENCLDNIINKTSDWKQELDWVGKEGLIVFDDVGYGVTQDDLRSEGYNVIGGSAGGDIIELDRQAFKEALTSHGIKTLPSYNFYKVEEGIDFVKKNHGPWVLKQSSHLGMLNHVGTEEDGSDVIEALKSYKKYHLEEFNLQKKVSGVEVGVARYFNGIDWVGPIEINHEHKRLYNGDEGPLTHEMGTVMWFSEDENLPIFEKTLAKLKPYLQKVNFIGDIDINLIINEEGAWPLEATPRFGNPSTPLHCAMIDSPLGDFLLNTAKGNDTQSEFKSGYGVVVCVAVPPFPNPPMIINPSVYKTVEKKLSFADDLTPAEFNNIHLEEISLNNESSEYFWSGHEGWVLHVTGTGNTINEAKEQAYKIINKINLPDSFYRTDIGDRVKDKDIHTLKEWGWI